MTGWLALSAVTGYLLDAAGFGVQAWASLAVALAATGVGARVLPREPRSPLADLIAWLGIVVFVSAVLLRMAAPAYLPMGRGPDLTHHLLLVDYIEQNGHLVHDRSLGGAMGEMAHYTPGSHLLAVMAGQWFGTDGLHTFFPVVAVCAALTAGFVFLIGRRMGLTVPYAIAATTLLFLPARYFFGAFTHDAFLSQTVSTLFAIAAWWSIAAWDDQRVRRNGGDDGSSTPLAGVIAILLGATFLSWPMWIGPPLLVFLGLIRREHVPSVRRRRHLAIVIAPLLAIFLLHSWDRWGWMAILRTSGAVLQPSTDSIGWLLPVLAVTGGLAAMADRRSRIAVGFAAAIILQALTLFVIARSQGAETPYLALKMTYLLIYPIAVLAALAIVRVVGTARVSEPVGWLIAATLLLAAARPALAVPRNVPVVNDDLYQAGKWLRANGGAACADYLVGDAETAYWLHLAVLGNPRSSERTKELDRFNPRAAMAPWITAEGRSYAIADLRMLPEEVKSRINIRQQFGSAAAIARPGAQGCNQ